eukprot:132146_1
MNISDYNYENRDKQSALAICQRATTTYLLYSFTIEIQKCTDWTYYSPISNQYVSVNISTDTETFCPSTHVQSTNNTYSVNTTKVVTEPPYKNSSIPSNWLVPSWLDVNNSSVTYYVTADGNNFPDCGTEVAPCGTLWFTVKYATITAKYVKTIKSLIFIIRGQNKLNIVEENRNNNYFNPCLPWIFLDYESNDENALTFTSMVFTFDPDYISSKEDWFPTFPNDPNSLLCNFQNEGLRLQKSFFFVVGPYSTTFSEDLIDFTVTINNLIIDNWIFQDSVVKPDSIAGRESFSNADVKFIFNNLTFKDNTVMFAQSLMGGSQIEVYDSLFTNNIFYNVNAGSLFFVTSNSIVRTSRPVGFIMKRSVINNMTLSGSSSFVTINLMQSNNAQLYVLMTNNVFNSVEIENEAIINIDGYIRSNDISIKQNSFLIISGSIVKAKHMDSGLFEFADADISTTKIETHTLNPAFLMLVIDSHMNISNVQIDYFIINQLLDHCKVAQYVKGMCYGFGTEVNDYNSLKYWNFPGIETAKFEFNYTESIQYQCNPPISFISIIDSTGSLTEVNMYSITVTTDITHSQLQQVKQQLYQKNVWNCSISNQAVAEMYYGTNNLTGFIANRGNLRLIGLEIVGIGSARTIILQTDNAYTYAENIITRYVFDKYSLNINNIVWNLGGTMEIWNSNIYGTYGWIFIASDSATNNYIINSTAQYGWGAIFAEFGVSNVFISECNFSNIGKFFVATNYQLEWWKQTNTEDVYVSPLVLRARNSWIENSHIITDDASGIVTFASYSLSKAVLINNTITRNNENINISFNKSETNFIIGVFGEVEMYVINNKIIETKDSSKSLFFIDSTASCCFSGNIFQAATIINVSSGYIKSCSRPFIDTIFQNKNQCY